MDFYDVLEKRVSTRKFEKEKVSDVDINQLLYAAYKAPIANGLYDKCRLTVIKEKSLIEEISKEYMQLNGSDKDSLFDAPLFILFSSSKEDNSKYEDAGCVLENISLAASSLNLGSCYIRGAINSLGNEAKYIEKLNLDEGFFPVSGIVIGKTSKELKAKDHKITTNFI